MKKKDRIEIMFEKMQGDIQLVLEGYSVLNNKIDRLDERVGGIENSVKGLEFQIKTLDTSISLLNNEIRALHIKVDGIDEKLDKHINAPLHLAHAST